MLSILAGGIQPGAGGVCDGGVDSMQVDNALYERTFWEQMDFMFS